MDENTSQQNTPSEKIKTIHTYTSDMADAIRINEASVIKIALAEKEKREQEALYAQAQGTPVSKLLLTVGGILLIAFAVGGWYFISQKNSPQNTTPQPIKEMSALISYDSSVIIDVSDDKNQNDLLASLKTDIDTPGKPSSIKSLFLTENINKLPQPLSLQNLLFLLDAQLPDPLVRTLDGTYMLGTYTDTPDVVDARAHTFLILKVKEYNQAYASLLSWEKTMLQDLSTLFQIDIRGDQSYLLEKPWGDILINNKDARILYDRRGTAILYYIFPSKDTIIITDSQDAIKEISLRLLAKITKPL